MTERVVDTAMLGDRERMRGWLDGWMEKGDPFETDDGDGKGKGGRGGGILGRLFGGGS